VVIPQNVKKSQNHCTLVGGLVGRGHENLKNMWVNVINYKNLILCFGVPVEFNFEKVGVKP